MYQRYSPNLNSETNKPEKSQSGNMNNHNRFQKNVPLKGYPSRGNFSQVQDNSDFQRKTNKQTESKNNYHSQKIYKKADDKNFIFNFLPTSVYNPNTQKVFGFMTAEDLMLGAAILILLENKDSENQLLALALLYVLVSDYIDLPI